MYLDSSAAMTQDNTSNDSFDESTELITEYDIKRNSRINSSQVSFTPRFHEHSTHEQNTIQHNTDHAALEQREKNLHYVYNSVSRSRKRYSYGDEDGEFEDYYSNDSDSDYKTESLSSDDETRGRGRGISLSRSRSRSKRKKKNKRKNSKNNNNNNKRQRSFGNGFGISGSSLKLNFNVMKRIKRRKSKENDDNDLDLVHFGEDNDENKNFGFKVMDWEYFRVDGYWNYPIPERKSETRYHDTLTHCNPRTNKCNCWKLFCWLYCLWIPPICTAFCGMSYYTGLFVVVLFCVYFLNFAVLQFCNLLLVFLLVVVAFAAYSDEFNELIALHSLMVLIIVVIFLARILFATLCVLINLTTNQNETILNKDDNESENKRYSLICFDALIWFLAIIASYLYPIAMPFISLWICRWIEKQGGISSKFPKISKMTSYIDCIMNNNRNGPRLQAKYQSILRFILNFRLLQFYATISYSGANDIIISSNDNLDKNSGGRQNKADRKYIAKKRSMMEIRNKFQYGHEYSYDSLSELCYSLLDDDNINTSDRLWEQSIFFPFYELNWIDLLLTIITCIAHVVLIVGAQHYYGLIFFAFTLIFTILSIYLSYKEWNDIKIIHSNIHPKILKYCIFAWNKNQKPNSSSFFYNNVDISSRKWILNMFYNKHDFDALIDCVETVIYWDNIDFFVTMCHQTGYYQVDRGIGKEIQSFIGNSADILQRFVKRKKWKTRNNGSKNRVNNNNSNSNNKSRIKSDNLTALNGATRVEANLEVNSRLNSR